MRRSSGVYNRVKVSGSNSINFINNCVDLGLKLNNISRTSSKEVIFDVSDKDYKRLRSIDAKACNITTIEIGGKRKLLSNFLYRIGLVIGIVISLVGVVIFNNRLIQVHILGLTRTSEEVVLDSLEDLGITRFSYMNYDIEQLEQDLAKEFNFSLVSIVTKGNSLIINIKEELPDLESSYAPITADYNMIITSIKVYAGTPKIKVGDVVYKGDILVEPYIKKGEDIVYVTPISEIQANVFFSNSYVFKNNEDVLVRTGEYELIATELRLGRFTLTNKSKLSKFTDYETEEIDTQVSTYFLPIHFRKIYCYELEKKNITRSFEAEKESIVDAQKKSLYNSIPQGINIENETVKITPITDGYIINVHLMVIMNFKY